MLDLSIIIPFKDKANMTLQCLDSLQKFAPGVKEVLLVSNNSSEKELEEIILGAKKYDNSKVLVYDKPFNFQAINNWAAKKSTGKVIMLLNNDIELTEDSKGLLETMYNKALEKESGAVGAVLLYEDQKNIQHAGVYLVPGATADHLYIGKNIKAVEAKIERKEYYYDIRANIQVSAVTAAAVMIEKNKFDKIKGLDEEFIICGGDVDLCLRLSEAGYQTTLIGSQYGHMIHKESKSRSMLAVPYVDFVKSYDSYIRHFNIKTGDKYLHWKEVQNV